MPCMCCVSFLDLTEQLSAWAEQLSSTTTKVFDGQQCVQIGRFITHWATLQSRWQQLFSPNCPHCQAIFVKVSKSFIFVVKSFLGNFYSHLATFYWSHWLYVVRRTYNELSPTRLSRVHRSTKSPIVGRTKRQSCRSG